VDKKTKDTVALKKIFDAFQNDTDAQRTFREIMFLQVLSLVPPPPPAIPPSNRSSLCNSEKELEHENIISLLNVMKAENDKDIYLVFEFMGLASSSLPPKGDS